jgi:exopolysaccharide biosynthesis polyprenyl glycosylphosphotransferase
MPDESPRTPLPEAYAGATSHEVLRPLPLARSVPRVTLSRLLVVCDTLALVSALLVSYIVASGMPGQAAPQPSALALFGATLTAWLVGARLFGLYRLDGRPALHHTPREWVSLGQLAVIVTGLVLIVALATRINQPSRDEFLVFAVSAITFVIGRRVAIRALARHSDGYAQNALIVGAGEVGQLVARKLLRHPEYGVKLVGFVDTPPKRWRRDIDHVPVLGVIDDLASIVRSLAIDRVIVAFSRQNDQDTLARVRPLMALNVHVDVVPRMFEMIGPNSGLPNVEGIPLVSISPRSRSAAALRLKRAIDVTGASLGLILAAPVFMWAAWRIPRESPGPVFYRQRRLGANMHEFTMLKFRTMTVDADQSSHQAYVERAMTGEHTAGIGELYKLDRRDVVTPTGRWLRRTSLDELPQLINVLQGTMSLVGPRPCMGYEIRYFAPHHYERFLAPAGITGLWQVTARAHVSFAEALEMDVAYVRDWSLALDLSLILRTPVEVLRQRKATV